MDFAAPESATMALQTMNGFQLAGRPIKVGRPTTGQGSGGNPMMKVGALRAIVVLLRALLLRHA